MVVEVVEHMVVVVVVVVVVHMELVLGQPS